jgi:hypothetical protein
MVGGTTVHTSAATIVQRRGNVQDQSTLQVGQTLHVEGARQTDHSINARKISIDTDAPDSEFEIQGPIGGPGGTCPSIHFKVNGVSIATNASTVFETACTALKAGTKVDVNGTRQADGSVVATRVKKQD